MCLKEALGGFASGRSHAPRVCIRPASNPPGPRFHRDLLPSDPPSWSSCTSCL